MLLSSIETINTIIPLKKQQHISHIKKRVVESLEIQLKQVTKQGQRLRSWGLASLVLGAEAKMKKIQGQQDCNGS